MSISQQAARVFVSKLLDWGSINRRDFAWRRTKNAFHILIAELMLQRTVARQVEPIYMKFIAQYPSPQDVVTASLEEVAKDLKPLGLAYRALRLKKIAKMVTTNFGGRVPASEDELLKLPGVGRYVANAVLCFAFGEDVPLVDANVLRVIKRVFSITTSKEAHKKPEMWNLMATMIPKYQAREFNLSLLDFASLVCTAKNPLHEACPLKNMCDFYQKHAKRQQEAHSVQDSFESTIIFPSEPRFNSVQP